MHPIINRFCERERELLAQDTIAARIHPQAKEVIQMHKPASYSAELHTARRCAAQ